MSTVDTAISNLGPATVRSPLRLNSRSGDLVGNFVGDDVRVRYQAEVGGANEDLLFEKAGPRERIFFEPATTTAAIVTCGGLCPGLNTVIRSAFMELHHHYGVARVLGIRYGYRGLNPEQAEPPLELNHDVVDHIHAHGGSILGSSRGDHPIERMVDQLERLRVSLLLTVGGDGTQRGAHRIALEARRRGLPLAVVGVPKTIDNDILFVDRTFGFATAVDKAREVLVAAHCEAKGYPNGVALVRVMGRDSGYIAAGATLASQEVNFALVPEVPFHLDGEGGFLAELKRRLLDRHHAVIVAAEGAGQDLLGADGAARDASGNVLHKDIGLFLRERILAYFRAEGIEISLKYIDPSYYIRSVPANSEDGILCDLYARNAVHAAMAGKTDLIVGLRNDYIHVPIAMATERRQRLEPEGLLWRCVLSATGQPAVM